MLRKRAALVTDFAKRISPLALAGDITVISALSKIAKQVEATYPATDVVYKKDLCDILSALCSLHYIAGEAGEGAQAISVGCKFLVSLGMMCSEDALKQCDDPHSFDLQHAETSYPW
jgi:hypothetical protein